MNYNVKRLKAIAWKAKSEDRWDWYEAKMIQYFLDKAAAAAKVDMRDANVILDRLLKSEFCTYLMAEEKDENKKS